MKLTKEQIELLRNLAALEDAGLIQSGDTVLVSRGYDEGSSEVEIPSVVTYAGRRALEGER